MGWPKVLRGQQVVVVFSRINLVLWWIVFCPFGSKMAFVVELKIVIQSLEFAKFRSWTHIWLEADSFYVVQLFSSCSVDVPWFCLAYWSACLLFIFSINFQVTYTFHKGNKVANLLSKLVVQTHSVTWSHNLLDFCFQLIQEFLEGIVILNLVVVFWLLAFQFQYLMGLVLYFQYLFSFPEFFPLRFCKKSFNEAGGLIYGGSFYSSKFVNFFLIFLPLWLQCFLEVSIQLELFCSCCLSYFSIIQNVKYALQKIKNKFGLCIKKAKKKKIRQLLHMHTYICYIFFYWAPKSMLCWIVEPMLFFSSLDNLLIYIFDGYVVQIFLQKLSYIQQNH